MKARSDIAAMIGSRICHDLISPLGAIGNGVELLSMTGVAQSPEMALIAESVENANARIRFFRIAYGAASEDQTIARAEIASTLAAAARGGRLSYFWEAEGDQPRNLVRIAFLVLQCLETAMPYGGDIHILRDGETWEITGEADKLKIDEQLWTSLISARKRVAVTPALVQFMLLPIVAQESGRVIALKLAPERIVLRF